VERFMACRPDGNVVTAGRGCAADRRALFAAFASKWGGFFCSTNTLVPISTRLNRSATSSLVRRMQPLETNLPMVEGSLVPWVLYSLESIKIRRALQVL